MVQYQKFQLTELDLQELSNYGKVALAVTGSNEALLNIKDYFEVSSELEKAYSEIRKWLIGEHILARELYYTFIPELTRFTNFFPRNSVERSNFFTCYNIVYYSIGVIDKTERRFNKNLPYLPNEMAEFSDTSLISAFRIILKGIDNILQYVVKLNELYSTIKSLCPSESETKYGNPLKASDLKTIEKAFL